jgi:hypothetical protein
MRIKLSLEPGKTIYVVEKSQYLDDDWQSNVAGTALKRRKANQSPTTTKSGKSTSYLLQFGTRQAERATLATAMIGEAARVVNQGPRLHSKRPFAAASIHEVYATKVTIPSRQETSRQLIQSQQSFDR